MRPQAAARTRGVVSSRAGTRLTFGPENNPAQSPDLPSGAAGAAALPYPLSPLSLDIHSGAARSSLPPVRGEMPWNPTPRPRSLRPAEGRLPAPAHIPRLRDCAPWEVPRLRRAGVCLLRTSKWA